MIIREEDLRISVFHPPHYASGFGLPSLPSVTLHHIPTGTQVTVGLERSQLKNKAKALRALYQILEEDN